MIRSTAPVAVLAFVTRHRSRAVHEHERAHEDVLIVSEFSEAVSLGTKANW